jgi:hypothetical protein
VCYAYSFIIYFIVYLLFYLAYRDSFL